MDDLSLGHFLLPLVNRGENFVVFIKVFAQFVKQVCDIFVYPMAIDELVHQVHSINV